MRPYPEMLGLIERSATAAWLAFLAMKCEARRKKRDAAHSRRKRRTQWTRKEISKALNEDGEEYIKALGEIQQKKADEQRKQEADADLG